MASKKGKRHKVCVRVNEKGQFSKHGRHRKCFLRRHGGGKKKR